MIDEPVEPDQRIIYENVPEFLNKLTQSHNKMYHKCLMITPTAMFHIYITNDITQLLPIDEFTWQHPYISLRWLRDKYHLDEEKLQDQFSTFIVTYPELDGVISRKKYTVIQELLEDLGFATIITPDLKQKLAEDRYEHTILIWCQCLILSYSTSLPESDVEHWIGGIVAESQGNLDTVITQDLDPVVGLMVMAHLEWDNADPLTDLRSQYQLYDDQLIATIGRRSQAWHDGFIIGITSHH